MIELIFSAIFWLLLLLSRVFVGNKYAKYRFTIIAIFIVFAGTLTIEYRADDYKQNSIFKVK